MKDEGTGRMSFQHHSVSLADANALVVLINFHNGGITSWQRKDLKTQTALQNMFNLGHLSISGDVQVMLSGL